MTAAFFSTENDLLAFSAQLAQATHSGAIIFLYGPLGVGKTTFVRGFLRALGYQEKVKSPTYTIVEPYLIAGKNIFHFDLYRIKHPKELEYLGIEEYFSPDTICLIEWPDKGLPILPEADLACYFSFEQEGRKVKIEAQTKRGEEIVQEWDRKLSV